MSFSATILKLCALALLSSCHHMIDAAPFRGGGLFRNSFYKLGHTILSSQYDRTNGNQNIVIAPFALEASIWMLRLGVRGDTADEIDENMNLIGPAPNTTADNIHHILAMYEHSRQVMIANKITKLYYGDNLDESYEKLIAKKFLTTFDTVKYDDRNGNVEDVNSWFESKTNYAIGNMVDSQLSYREGDMFLLSAFAFQAEWEKTFESEKKRFYVDDFHYTDMDFITMRSVYPYMSYPDLEATSIAIPFKNNISMWIFLPNSKDGLADMLQELEEFDIFMESRKLKKMGGSSQMIHLPKFSAEFHGKLDEDLKDMGIYQLFESSNDFHTMMTEEGSTNGIQNFIHKTKIEFMETGTIQTDAKGQMPYDRMGYDHFTCDHPFFYMIVNEYNIVLLEGVFVGAQ